MGFLGPVAIKIPMAVDPSVAAMKSVVVGGNEVDIHFKGVVPGRDFPLDNVVDLRNAGEGDPCPHCGKPMTVRHGIEIGHVFKLGTKYSKSMGATFLDDKGNEVPVIMGCYGIGVSRLIAASVEAGHDANGILWPLAIAPYHVVVVPLQVQNAAVIEAAEGLVKQFEAAGVDVLFDDRDQRPGVKFKDADLIGVPLRVVVGERGLKEGTIEVKWRNADSAHHVAVATAGEAILAELESTRKAQEALCVERRVARAAAKGR
jgi:prolyl-tRNA synthetase